MNLQFFRRLSLTSKGLVIVTIPLLFQIAFFTFYQKLLDDTDQLVSAEDHAKNVIGRVNWISALVLAADLGGLGYRYSGDKRLLETLNYAKPRMIREINDTAELVQKDQNQATLVAKIKKETDQLLSLVDEHTGKQSAITIGPGEELNIAIIARLSDLRHKLLVLETDNQNFTVSHTRSNRLIRRDFIAFGILLDGLMALIIFTIFSRTITTRLMALTKNVKRFSHNQALEPMLGGEDEVGLLDQNFHEMAEALNIAKQRKQEYLQMLSHDLRTPIANVLLALELLKMREVETSEKGKKDLTSAERNLGRVLDLINQILEMETLESGKMALDLDAITSTALCSKAIDAVQYLAARRGIAIEKSGDELDLVADMARLEQVMVNLLGNAIKFSPDDSKIVIDCKMHDKDDNLIRISIADSGRGIPEAFIQGVFERFRQVRMEDQKIGSGLGLAVCKAIVEAHGGQIGVESKEGVGSTFWFELPTEPPTT